MLVSVVQALYDQLLAQRASYNYPAATQTVALSILPSILSLYHTSQPPNTWLNKSHLNVSLTAVNDTITALTDPTLGLMYVDPSKPGVWAPAKVAVSLNAWAAWLVEQVKVAKRDQVCVLLT